MTIAPESQFYIFFYRYRLMPVYPIVFNVKVLVGTFNQEKVVVGAFSVIVKTECENR